MCAACWKALCLSRRCWLWYQCVFKHVICQGKVLVFDGCLMECAVPHRSCVSSASLQFADTEERRSELQCLFSNYHPYFKYQPFYLFRVNSPALMTTVSLSHTHAHTKVHVYRYSHILVAIPCHAGFSSPDERRPMCTTFGSLTSP